METEMIKQRLVKASEFVKNIEHEEWLIESILPKNGLVEIIGASGSYKTFIVLDMLFCIASGLKYHNYSTTKGTVVYVCGESSTNIKKRIRALEMKYQIYDYDFYVLPVPSNLYDTQDVMRLSQEISNLSINISMLVFDTLHRNSSGSDENSAKDFGMIVLNIDKFLKPQASIVAWIHHTGLNSDANSRGRGTSSRFAALDTQILVTKKQRLQTILTNTKQRDCEEFPQITFNLESFNIDFLDESGNQISTLIPVISSDSISVTKKSSLKSTHVTLVKLLKECILRNGVELSDKLKEDKKLLSGKMVLANIWRDEALKIIDSKGEHEAKMKAFGRYKKVLLNENVVGEFENYVYIIQNCQLASL